MTSEQNAPDYSGDYSPTTEIDPMHVIQAPLPINSNTARPWLFLAGSIEMGAAMEWQKTLVERLKKTKGTIFNPRRDDWDDKWVQRADNPKFYKQVTWELMAMDMADLVFFNFVGGTKSPVTMLEFGLCAAKRPESTVLRASDDFWRFGNLEIVASQCDPIIGVIHAFDDAVRYLQTRLKIKNEMGTIPTATGKMPAHDVGGRYAESRNPDAVDVPRGT